VRLFCFRQFGKKLGKNNFDRVLRGRLVSRESVVGSRLYFLDRKAPAAALKPLYQAANAAAGALEVFAQEE
jgi:hypothetical protein